MQRPLTAVMLAGRIRPSPLSQGLDVHVLCLPVGVRGSLLDAWMTALAPLPGLTGVQVVVNTPDDVETVIATAGAYTRGKAGPHLRVLAEPAAWRGAAGIVRDVTGDLPPDGIVLVFEAKRLPPASIDKLIQPLLDDDSLSGVVGVCGEDEPAGAYAFARSALGVIPHIGYFDLKEQFLPSLSRSGGRIVTARLSDTAWRMRDIESYLESVRHSLAGASLNGTSSNGAGNSPIIRASDRASVSGSAVLDGFCVIEPGAVIEDGAVVHDSVVLWGATVGGGAVVSRSVVGPLSVVEPRARVIRTLVARPRGDVAGRLLDPRMWAGDTRSRERLTW